MQLEEMKSLWTDMSVEISKQKKLTESLIIRMTRADYRNKLNKILIPEIIGATVCFAASLFIGMNFQKLDTWYLLACGIIAAVILLLLPVLSLWSIHKLRSVNILDNNYKQSLLEYSTARIKFVFIQRLSFYLGSILLLVVLPVMSRLISGIDIFVATRLWIWYSIGYIIFYPFAMKVFKSYIKTTADAKNILKELES